MWGGEEGVIDVCKGWWRGTGEVPQVYLIIRGGHRSHHVVIGGLVVIVERLNGLGLGKGRWE